MSLRILFADDSVTAQNMGKKILTEAGYDVVAVSNGAAAVKKIAEQKPDIIILDVYMPGYSGLEVCEKVRSSLATIKTPVLLTVGKMEPYKPEDANRVRADGVIIKPFEASDLIAIIKKFEERIAQMPAPPAPAPPPVRRPVEDIPELEMHHPEAPTAVLQPMVEVPDHMATSSAFSDLLGGDSGHAPMHPPLGISTPSGQSPSTDFDLPVSWRQQPEPIVAAPAASDTQAIEPIEEAAPPSAPEVAAVPEPDPVGAPAARPVPIPVFQETASAAPSYEVVPTAAGPIGDIDIPREPALQETAEETTRNTVADAREPGLVPSSVPVESEIASVATHAVEPPLAQNPSYEPEVAPQAAEVNPPEPAAGPATSSVTDDEFEARVAAAMAAYGNGSNPVAVQAAAAATPGPEPVPSVPVQAMEASAPPETFEYQPPVHSTHAAAEPSQEQPVEAVPSSTHEAVAAKIEEELPSAVAAVAEAAAASPAEHENIAQVVHRVMERMKGDLVDEIVRELRKK